MVEINTNSGALPSTNSPPTNGPPSGLGGISDNSTNENGISNFKQAADTRALEDLFSKIQTQNTTNKAETPLKTISKPNEGSFFTKLGKGSLSMMEFTATMPLLFTSLIMQADNIVKQRNYDPNSFLINFITTTIETCSTPFKAIFNYIVPQVRTIEKDLDDVSTNKRPFMLDSTIPRLAHPAFTKQMISLIFTLRRSLFTFLPSLFTVPAEEHDPSKPRGAQAGSISTGLFYTLSTILSPLRVLSSLTSASLGLPAHLLGVISAYKGDQKPFEFAHSLAKLSNYILPATSCLNSLYKVSKACLESLSSKDKLSKRVAFEKYNIDITNVIQGVIGSITAIPYLCGGLVKIKNKLTEIKDPNDRNNRTFKFAEKARDFIGEIALELKTMDLIGEDSLITTAQQKVYNIISKAIEYLDNFSNSFVQRLMNSNALFKNFFSTFRPISMTGEVLANNSSQILESANPQENYVWNSFKKSNFFNEIYDFLHPIQSLLMLLPNAFVGSHDPYIQDNGTRMIRLLDRLVGVNSLILSLPNYLLYAANTRIPQMFIKILELMQRRADIKLEDYDAYDTYIRAINWLRNSGIPGSKYLSNSLSDLDLKPGNFRSPEIIKKQFDHLENGAIKQEHSVKASELVDAMRIGLRHLIGTESQIFFTPRDAEGYTEEERSRKKAYDAIGTFNTMISRFPVVGWIASPILSLFRSFYTTKDLRHIKQLGQNRPTAVAA